MWRNSRLSTPRWEPGRVVARASKSTKGGTAPVLGVPAGITLSTFCLASLRVRRPSLPVMLDLPATAR